MMMSPKAPKAPLVTKLVDYNQLFLDEVDRFIADGWIWPVVSDEQAEDFTEEPTVYLY